jgi:hypothetical protein
MISKEVASALSDEAKKEGRTLFSLSNEIIEIYLQARRKNYDFKEMLNTYATIKQLKEAGYVLVPSEIFDMLVSSFPLEKRKALLQSFHESGNKLAKILEDTNLSLVTELKLLIKLLFRDLSVNVEQDRRDLLALTIMSIDYDEIKSSIVSEFLEGFLKGYNHILIRKEMMKGLIKAKFRVTRTDF